MFGFVGISDRERGRSHIARGHANRMMAERAMPQDKQRFRVRAAKDMFFATKLFTTPHEKHVAQVFLKMCQTLAGVVITDEMADCVTIQCDSGSVWVGDNDLPWKPGGY